MREVKSSAQQKGTECPNPEKKDVNASVFIFTPACSMQVWFGFDLYQNRLLEISNSNRFIISIGSDPFLAKIKAKKLMETEPNPFGCLERRSTTDA